MEPAAPCGADPAWTSTRRRGLPHWHCGARPGAVPDPRSHRWANGPSRSAPRRGRLLSLRAGRPNLSHTSTILREVAHENTPRSGIRSDLATGTARSHGHGPAPAPERRGSGAVVTLDVNGPGAARSRTRTQCMSPLRRRIGVCCPIVCGSMGPERVSFAGRRYLLNYYHGNAGSSVRTRPTTGWICYAYRHLKLRSYISIDPRMTNRPKRRPTGHSPPWSGARLPTASKPTWSCHARRFEQAPMRARTRDCARADRHGARTDTALRPTDSQRTDTTLVDMALSSATASLC